MRVVITGGTGFVGRNVASLLAARGDDVTVLTRDGSGKPEARVRFGVWTPSAAGDWQRTLEDADAVVSLQGAGVMDERWTAARVALLRKSRVDSTRLIAEAIARAPKKATLVSASAVGVYGMRMDGEILDERGAHGQDVLAEICEAWEGAAALAREAGARIAMARIGMVLGPGGGALAKLLPPFRAFVGGPLGAGSQWISWVHVEDVVRAIAFAIDTPTFAGPFNLTAPNPVTMNELARAVGHSLRRPARMRVPAVALRAALGARAEAILTGQRAIPRHLLDSGFTFAFPRLDEALADILSGV